MIEKRSPASGVPGLSSGASALAVTSHEHSGSTCKAVAAPHSEKRIPSAAVRHLCGGVSDMTLWRWLNEPAMGFPRPTYIARRRYWRETDVIAWLEAQAAGTAG